MKTCSRCKISKPLKEFYKAKNAPQGVQSHCKECEKLRYAENRATKLARSREYYKENSESILAKCATHYSNNKQVYKERAQAVYKLKRDEIKEKTNRYKKENEQTVKARQAEYYKNKKSDYIERDAKRKAAKLKQTPKWANNAAIKDIYADAAELTVIARMCGDDLGFHVDHIIPLQGREVRGLHVETNLAIIPAKENLSKGNRL